MTFYTATDLATLALKTPGLYGSDETPSASDLEDAKLVIASELASMRVRGVNIIGGSGDAVPLEYLSPLSRRLALTLLPMFGAITVAEATVAIPPAEVYLRQLSAKQATGAVVKNEYY